jgi:uncharacterized protein (TIGR00297 family)
VARNTLNWQSKLIMLMVFPPAAAGVILQTRWWAENVPQVAIWSIGLSLLLALVACFTRSATPAAAAAGAVIAATLIFSTASLPFKPWKNAISPVITLLLLTSLATKAGRKSKNGLRATEDKRGRNVAQVAANLGIAVLASEEAVQSWLANTGWTARALAGSLPLFTIALASLAEAAADTVSSELGELLGSKPRMITTLRRATPGTDGAISIVGSVAGAVAAAIVSAAGSAALNGGITMFWISLAAGVFGMLFDSLLGATLEHRGTLNNDAVNFLSAASAAVCAMLLIAIR